MARSAARWLCRLPSHRRRPGSPPERQHCGRRRFVESLRRPKSLPVSCLSLSGLIVRGDGAEMLLLVQCDNLMVANLFEGTAFLDDKKIEVLLSIVTLSNGLRLDLRCVISLFV